MAQSGAADFSFYVPSIRWNNIACKILKLSFNSFCNRFLLVSIQEKL